MADDNIRDQDLESTKELTNFVKTVLNQMNDRFTSMSENIVNRIDEMTDRISDLEQTVSQLVDESNEMESKSNFNTKQDKSTLSNFKSKD